MATSECYGRCGQTVAEVVDSFGKFANYEFEASDGGIPAEAEALGLAQGEMSFPEGVREEKGFDLLKGRVPGGVLVCASITNDFETQRVEMAGDLDVMLEEPEFVGEPCAVPENNARSEVGIGDTLVLAAVVETHEDPTARGFLEEGAPLRFAQVHGVWRVAVFAGNGFPTRETVKEILVKSHQDAGVTGEG